MIIGENTQIDGSLEIWTSATITSSGIISAGTFRDYNYTGGLALVSDNNKDIVEISVTSAQINYLNTTSANIQTQLNNLSASNVILDSQLDLYLPLSGGTMTGDINVGVVGVQFNSPSLRFYKSGDNAAVHFSVPSSGTRAFIPQSTTLSANANLGDPSYVWRNGYIDNISATSLTVGQVSNTELQHLNNVSANIQNQLSALSATKANNYTIAENQLAVGGTNVISGSNLLTFDDVTLGIGLSANINNPKLHIIQNPGQPGGAEIFLAAAGTTNDENSGKLRFQGNNRIVGLTNSTLKHQVYNNSTSAWETIWEKKNTNTADKEIAFAGPVSLSGFGGTAKVLVSNTQNQIVESSSITESELNYLNGTSANIQNQLSALSASDSTINNRFNSYLPLSGGTMVGLLDMNNQQLYFNQSNGLRFGRSGDGSSIQLFTPTSGTRGLLPGTTSASQNAFLGSGSYRWNGIFTEDLESTNAIKISAFSGSKVLVSDSSKNIVESSLPSSGLNFLSNVSGDVQTQLNNLSGTSHTHNNKATLDLINQSLNTSATVAFSQIDLGKGVNINSTGNTDWLHIADFPDTSTGLSRKYYLSIMGGDWSDNAKIEYLFDTFSTGASQSAFSIERINSTWRHGSDEIYNNLEFKTFRNNSNNDYSVYVRGSSVDFFSLAADVKYTNGVSGAYQYYVQTSADVNLPTSATHTEIPTSVHEQPVRLVNDRLFIRNINLTRGNSYNISDTSAVSDIQFSGSALFPNVGYDLGTSSKRWNNIFGLSANIGNISATSITVGNIDNTEFGYLNTVSANIQNQLSALSATKANNYTIAENQLAVGGTNVISGSDKMLFDGTTLSIGLSSVINNPQLRLAHNPGIAGGPEIILGGGAGATSDENSSKLKFGAGNSGFRHIATTEPKYKFQRYNSSTSAFENVFALDSTVTSNKDVTFYGSVIAPTLSATTITVGNIDNTEFQFLNNVSANVQTQLTNLSATKANSSVTITAGTMLSGGGDLTTNRTISHQTVGTSGTYSNIVTNSTGHVTSARALISADIPTIPPSKILEDANDRFVTDVQINNWTSTSATVASNSANWNTAFTSAHFHTNKATLDLINQSLNTIADVTFSTLSANDISAVNIIDSSYVGNRALVSDSNKYLIESSITDTQLSHLAGVSANIQTQINQLSQQAVSGNGAGTVNRITKFVTSSSMGDSSITDNGSLVTFTTQVSANNTITAPNFTGLASRATSALQADTLKTSRNFSLSGAVTSNVVSFNGSGNVVLSATLTSGINASAIANGTISNTEFQFLDNVSANIQTQLTNLSAGKANNTVTITAGTMLSGGGDLTTNRTISHQTVGTSGTYSNIVTNSTGHITSARALISADIPTLPATKIGTGIINDTEFNYLDNVSANIQTQLTNLSAGKLSIGATASGDLGGTYPNPSVLRIAGVSVALSQTGPLYFNGSTIQSLSNISADSYTDTNYVGDRVLVSNSSKQLIESSISNTILSAMANSRVGQSTYTVEDTLALSARNSRGVNFGRMFNNTDSPSSADYWNYIQMPETIGGFSQTLIAQSTTNNDVYFGRGAWNTSPTWVKAWTSNDFSQTNINNWNTAYTNNHTHSNKSTLDLINQSLNTSATISADKFHATNNGNGTNFRVGDDTWIGDINQANTMSLRGIQSSAIGYMRFGSDTNSFGYDGSRLIYGNKFLIDSNRVSAAESTIKGRIYLESDSVSDGPIINENKMYIRYMSAVGGSGFTVFNNCTTSSITNGGFGFNVCSAGINDDVFDINADSIRSHKPFLIATQPTVVYNTTTPQTYIAQAIASNDYWRIYGEGSPDIGSLILEVGDNYEDTIKFGYRNVSNTRLTPYTFGYTNLQASGVNSHFNSISASGNLTVSGTFKNIGLSGFALFDSSTNNMYGYINTSPTKQFAYTNNGSSNAQFGSINYDDINGLSANYARLGFDNTFTGKNNFNGSLKGQIAFYGFQYVSHGSNGVSFGNGGFYAYDYNLTARDNIGIRFGYNNSLTQVSLGSYEGGSENIGVKIKSDNNTTTSVFTIDRVRNITFDTSGSVLISTSGTIPDNISMVTVSATSDISRINMPSSPSDGQILIINVLAYSLNYHQLFANNNTNKIKTRDFLGSSNADTTNTSNSVKLVNGSYIFTYTNGFWCCSSPCTV